MNHHRGLQVTMWILARLVPEGKREALVGDLMEEHALRASSESPSAALKWSLQQVCASVPPLLWARLRGTAWISTFGVALLAYTAVIVVSMAVYQAIPNSPVASGDAYMLPRVLRLVGSFPAVVLIAYFAAKFRRRAPIVLGVTMLLMITLMMFPSNQTLPTWYRIADFLSGPAAAFIGGALRSAVVRRANARRT